MVTILIKYKGNLRCESVHEPSGSKLLTDAPVDNRGLGKSFSPTDLVATALGTCMLTIMGIYAEDKGLDIKGTNVTVVKEMRSAPRKISTLKVEIVVPGEIPEEHKDKLAEAARTCPVALSLHPDITVETTFRYG